jgi:hypothetical protein
MKTWNKLLMGRFFLNEYTRFTFAVLIFLSLALSSYAQTGQVYRYKSTSFTGSWASISGTGSYLAGGIDDGSFSFAGPNFAFNYDSVNYNANTTMYMGWNGLVGWKTPSNGNFYNDGVGSSQLSKLVCFFACDLYFGSGSGVYSQTTGTSPNRVFTVERDNWCTFINTSYITSVQIKFYETSNIIEVLYKDHGFYLAAPADGDGGGVGLNGDLSTSSTDYIRYGSSAMTSTPSTDVRFSPPINTPPSQLSLQPKSLDFGSLFVGDADTLCVTASSVGVNKLAINGTGLSGSPDFSLVSATANNGDSLNSGATATYCFRFSPITIGLRSATFTLVTNGQDSGTQFVTLVGHGKAPAVRYGATSLFRREDVKLGDSLTQYIPVSSTGTGPLTFSSIYIKGLDSNSYFVSYFPQNPLTQGTSDSIGITFAPEVEGRPDAEVVINSDAINIPSDTVTLLGIGIIGHLVVTPSIGSGNTLSFDSVSMGDSVCATISLTNIGTDTVRITHQVLASADADFTFYPLSGADTMILPEQTKLANVCFKPIKEGIRFATIRFLTDIPLTFETPRLDTSSFTINVTGVGVPFGQLSVAGQLVDSAIIGQQVCEIDTVRNLGSSPILITSATLDGTNASEFTASGLSPVPFTLQPGQSKMVTICFTPQARGLRTAHITFTGTTSDKLLVDSVQILGYGLQTCASATPMPATFGTNGLTLVGSTDTAIITVTNCGDVTTVYTAAPSPAAYTILGPSTSGNVAPNGTTTFTVLFTPTAIGAVPGTLSFQGGLPSSVPLGGVGAGVNATASGEGPTIPKGSCQNFTVTITNNGNIDWNAGTPTITGSNAADFTLVSGPTPNPIPAHSSAQIVFNFCPTTTSSESAQLTFQSSSPTPLTPFSYPLTGNGTTSGVPTRSLQNGFSLDQNYPNPFHGQTQLTIVIPQSSVVRLDIVNQAGEVVQSVMNQHMDAGSFTVTIDATNLASGTYYYSLTSGNVRLTRQMVLVK